MIPEAKQPAVARALNEAFGVEEFEDIRRLTAGLTSALVFRIVVRRHPYLLRVITRTDDMSDPTRQFACMKSDAERGIAPRVLYASIEDQVSITDFVEARLVSLFFEHHRRRSRSAGRVFCLYRKSILYRAPQ